MTAMPPKSSQPALYEKMRKASGASSANPTVSPKVDLHPSAVHMDNSDSHGGWLAPGRAIRLPTGYVLLGCGIAILLLTVTYVLGHKRGAAVARAQYEQRVIDSTSPPANDPLNSLQPVIDGTTGSSGTATNAASAALNPIRTAPPSTWGAVKPAKDPRQKGMNYFILMETHEAGATQLAEFCRTQGLETYAVPAKNSRYRVVAFPGFAGRDRASAPVKALEAQIQNVGEQWRKQRGSGREDLTGFYPSLYNG